MTGIVIMAAGKGTRMKSDLPKVLHEIAGKPLLTRVLETANVLSPERIVVILGHGRDQVSEILDKKKVSIAIQDPPQGTGHAVMQAEAALKDFEGNVVILSGDVPLLTSSSLQALVKYHQVQSAVLTVASAVAPNPTGYGRIVRDASGEFLSIVEHKDATDEQHEIDEINTGIYCVNCEALFSALHRTTNDNAKGEFYLTDIVAILREDGARVVAANLFDYAEVQGINTQEELSAAERAFIAREDVGT